MLSVATWYEVCIHKLVCQGTKSALMSKATVSNSRQRYVPKLVYSVLYIIKDYLGVVKCSLFYGQSLYIACNIIN